MRTKLHPMILSLCAASAVMVSTVTAAGPGSDAQSRYEKDRAACMSGNSNQDRATCLREAGAALVEARRDGLTTTDSTAPTYRTAWSGAYRCPPPTRKTAFAA